MKKWIALALLVLLLSGCSFSRVWKFFDEMDYERDDKTIQIVHFLIK
jgi:hypothetical protein